MCLSCGCGDPDNDHNNYGNITVQKLFDAANAVGIDVEDVVNNIENTYALKVANRPFRDVDIRVLDDEDNS